MATAPEPSMSLYSKTCVPSGHEEVSSTFFESSSIPHSSVLFPSTDKDSLFAKADISEALRKLIENLRTDLNAPNLPVVVGELGPYLEKAGDPPFTAVNEALRGVATNLPKVAVASSAGLTDRGDHLHFNTASQRTFGERFAAEMIALQK